MNKRVNLIIGSGVLGAYLSAELLKKKETIIVTSRSIKKQPSNYKFLKIHKKIKFEKLDTNKKNQINEIVKKYNPKKIEKPLYHSIPNPISPNRQENLNGHKYA